MLTGALTALLMPISGKNLIFPLGIAGNSQEDWREVSEQGEPPAGLAGWCQNRGGQSLLVMMMVMMAMVVARRRKREEREKHNVRL